MSLSSKGQIGELDLVKWWGDSWGRDNHQKEEENAFTLEEKPYIGPSYLPFTMYLRGKSSTPPQNRYLLFYLPINHPLLVGFLSLPIQTIRLQNDFNQ